MSYVNHAAEIRDDAAPSLSGPVSSIASRIELSIETVFSYVAGLLVAVEVVILLIGVIARYAFHAPLPWTDELAQILLLWTGMVGAVVAYAKGTHMRMGVLADGARPSVKAFLDAVALVVGLAFIATLLYPSIEYTLHEAVISTPSLEISSAWRTIVLPISFGVMLILGAIKAINSVRLVHLIGALCLLAVVTGLLFLGKPWIAQIGNYRLLLFFVVIVGGAVFAGVPIAYSFCIATLAYLVFSTRMPLQVMVGRIDEGMSHIILLSVPLFVYLGFLLVITGMARTMVGFLASLLGHVRGGLHYVLVGAMYLVSGISGSKAADMAAVAPVLFPEMEKRGAKKGDLVALLSATGAQTETVPPSIVLITLGSVTGVSISALFQSGLLPSAMLAAMLCAVVWRRYRKTSGDRIRRATGKEIGRALIAALPALLLPFIIRGVVIEGVATATEVSTIGITYALLYAGVASVFFHEKIEWSRLGSALIETAVLSGAILFIMGAASAMAWALTQSGFSRDLAGLISGLPGGAAVFMIASVIAFIVLGAVLEGLPAIVLFGPLLFPIAKALQIHEVHYAIVAVIAMGLGLFAPPFGVGYYTACAIAKVNPAEGVRAIAPYLFSLALGLIVIAAVPWISIGFL